MIHAQDVEILERITAVREFPQEFIDEYRHHLRNRHLSGTGLGVGFDILTQMLWRHKVAARAIGGISDGRQDWRSVAMGEPVIAKGWDGADLPGKFAGMLSAGVIAVRVDGREWVEEFPAVRVSLANPPGSEVEMFRVSEQAIPSDPPPAVLNANTDEDCATDKVERWSEIEDGTEVIVDIAGDLVPGIFRGLSIAKGCIAVEVNGKTHALDPNDVTPADKE